MLKTKDQISKEDFQALVKKYSAPIPRYTSYPTAPEWKDAYDHTRFLKAIEDSNSTGGDYSLYLHIPFCESQCYYCGCNVVISEKHGIEERYIESLREEIEFIGSKIDKNRRVVQLAFGGGTPTYLNLEQWKDVFRALRENFNLFEPYSNEPHEYSVEVDPRITSVEQLKLLYELGVNRLSFGVQDFNPKTQEAINRIQSFEMVEALMSSAREIGFKSINLDLVYGLPYQSLESFAETISKIKLLDPERIALFNYAHIPSIFPFQKKYIPDESLPSPEEKLQVFMKAHDEFLDFGYEFIGMDHFAKPDDELAIAQKEGTLYRNFQGFTTHYGCDLFGLGVTAISDASGVYKQNPKKLNAYNEQFLNSEFDADKFKVCSEEDLFRRKVIVDLMSNYQAKFSVRPLFANVNKEFWDAIENYEAEGFIETRLSGSIVPEVFHQGESEEYVITVTELGKFFVRNIASAFDAYLATGHKVFSKAL